MTIVIFLVGFLTGAVIGAATVGRDLDHSLAWYLGSTVFLVVVNLFASWLAERVYRGKR